MGAPGRGRAGPGAHREAGAAAGRVDYAPSVSVPSSSPRPEPRAARSRRVLLLGTLGVGGLGLLTGCDLSEVVGRRGASGERAAQEADPDLPLLEQLVADVAEVTALVEATVVAHPALGPTLDGVRGAHADHARVLQGLVDRSADGPGTSEPAPPSATSGADAGSPRVPARLDRAWARVRQVEAEHAAALLGGARTASAGPLARVLASAGAGLTTHLAALPQDSTGTVSP